MRAICKHLDFFIESAVALRFMSRHRESTLVSLRRGSESERLSCSHSPRAIAKRLFAVVGERKEYHQAA